MKIQVVKKASKYSVIVDGEEVAKGLTKEKALEKQREIVLEGN